MMLASIAEASAILNREDYLEIAKASPFLLDNLVVRVNPAKLQDATAK